MIELIVWEFLWGMPLIFTILAVGIYYSIRTKFFQVIKLPYILKDSFDRLFRAKNKDNQDGVLSPLESVSLSIGATVGVGNIGGVATAIAFGGPGAVFWMWVAGLFGKIIKMAEVTLAVHYRSTDKNGETYGGPTYYIKKGLHEERKSKKLYKVLNFIFILGFGTVFFLTIQNYTVSEAVSSTFQINQVLVSFVYLICFTFSLAEG
nr:alanine:cation symporter family protein [Halalkalibacter krulwichiae]